MRFQPLKGPTEEKKTDRTRIITYSKSSFSNFSYTEHLTQRIYSKVRAQKSEWIGWEILPRIILQFSWITGGPKVLAQNVCSFLAHLKIFQTSRKLWIRTRILCSFWIWAWKFFVSLCSRVVRESLKGLKILFGRDIFSHFFIF